ncbi:MAG: hypothetical protein HYU86_06970 [Chloroflexi bacterium]|nr:hypothetical protein [Chloroflexota bacterium]
MPVSEPAKVPAPVSEPDIPAHYTTYTDEAKLFSISYPPEWQTNLSLIKQHEETAKGIISSLESGLPAKVGGQLFFAGIPALRGYAPAVSVQFLPPYSILGRTVPYSIETIIGASKRVLKESYREFSRVKTTIGGREATIVDFEGTFVLGQEKVYAHQLVMVILVGENSWQVTCLAREDFASWAKDFDAIVRSFRILK